MHGKPRSPYQYSALKQRQGCIRLLLLERDRTNPITAQLREFDLVDFDRGRAPRYYALSYAWGTGSKRVPIIIDEREFLITASLAAGLEQLVKLDPVELACQSEHLEGSFPTSDLYIWCDQICIDQHDDDERGDQVRQMKDIYSKSQRTVVWLGVDTGFAAPAVDLLSHIERRYDSQLASQDGTRQMMTYIGRGYIDWNRHQSMELPSTWTREWKAMKDFLALPWFQRLWVIQEVVLSPQDPLLMIGKVRCSWTMVAWASHWLYILGYHDGYVSRSVRTIQMMLHMRRNSLLYDLSALIFMATSHLATDPRDNVYGVLGLEAPCTRLAHSGAIGSGNNVLLPDYSSSVQMAQWTAAQHVIKASNNLTILSLPTCRPPGCRDVYRFFGRQAFWTGVPSWLPHLEDVPRTRHFVNFYRASRPGHSVSCKVCPNDTFWSLMYHGTENFNASKSIAVRLVETPSRSSMLALKGIRFDKANVCLSASPWRGLAAQNGRVAKAPLMTGFARALQYFRECSHWGVIATFLYLVYTAWRAMQKPIALEIWQTAVLYSRYSDHLAIAKAVLHATTAGTDAAYNAWGPESVAHFAAYISATNRMWPNSRTPADVRQANTTLLRYAEQHQGDIETYAVAMQYWCGLRRFFVTERGYIGIGPTSMQKDDAIVVLYGGGVPFVLRRREDHWLFIGDCYVHELGEGQAIDMMEEGRLQEEVFRIY